MPAQPKPQKPATAPAAPKPPAMNYATAWDYTDEQGICVTKSVFGLTLSSATNLAAALKEMRKADIANIRRIKVRDE